MYKNYSLIVAIATDDTIGDSRTNDLLWKIPSDLKRFKSKTMNHVMIMGSKTFKSLGRVLPGRKHIVITRHPDSEYNTLYKNNENVVYVDSFDSALVVSGDDPTIVIGGGEIYTQALFHPINPPSVLYITLVDTDASGNVLFPVSGVKYSENGYCKIGKFYYVNTFASPTWSRENNYNFKYLEWKLCAEESKIAIKQSCCS